LGDRSEPVLEYIPQVDGTILNDIHFARLCHQNDQLTEA
jgi:hypothetical protein